MVFLRVIVTVGVLLLCLSANVVAKLEIAQILRTVKRLQETSQDENEKHCCGYVLQQLQPLPASIKQDEELCQHQWIVGGVLIENSCKTDEIKNYLTKTGFGILKPLIEKIHDPIAYDAFNVAKDYRADEVHTIPSQQFSKIRQLATTCKDTEYRKCCP